MLNDWEKVKHKIIGASFNEKWENKIEKAFWRGNPTGEGETIDEHKRSKLIMLSQMHKNLIDAKFLKDYLFNKNKFTNPIKNLI
jgi:hypothetical protein